MYKFMRVIFIVVSCFAMNNSFAFSETNTKISITKIDKSVFSGNNFEGSADAEVKACNKWKLTPAAIKKIYQLSEVCETSNSGQFCRSVPPDFNWMPCDIDGELIDDGVAWHFSINAAGMSVWRNEQQEITKG
ncbi:hypothetical protein [Pseudocitrobacter corydidari]|uniref:Uncharacterized protein n=1 Tax=Pseudocitrobacter corydidari TaxID=2891570 RepID=A0ABY3S1K4_9ENTR|nr:hypothetical protein [Pseudocitrobacter corydidari]UGS40108.1 hypothetical protein G163CM_08010 [Pseudocitrobacter corydidari]